MSSASSETPMFLGIDENDTVEVKLGTAVFQVGVMPAGLWERFVTTASLEFMAAKRRAIRAVHADGMDPDEVMDEDVKRNLKITRADIVANNDPVYRETLTKLQVQAVRYALRGHQNLCNQKGEPIPFSLVEEQYEGAPIKAVAPATLAFYMRSMLLLKMFWVKIKDLHELGVVEKKA